MKESKRTLPSLIGVIHLPPLPGAPGSRDLLPADALAFAGAFAVKEAQTLSRAGFQALILENFGDIPFYKDSVPPETVASLAVIAAAVRESTRAKIGINVLRNDAKAALAIAAVSGADFIRVNVLAGVAASDQGILEGKAAELMRERSRLNADQVAVLADVQVKHAQTLSTEDLYLSIEEAALRAGADAAIVTGQTTGRAPSLQTIQTATQASRELGVRMYLGSGTTIEALSSDPLREYLRAGNGAIVGSALRRAGKAGAPLDLKRVRKFIEAWKKAGKGNGKTRRASS